MSLLFYMFSVVSALAGVIAAATIHPIIGIPALVQTAALFAIGTLFDRVRDVERHAEHLDAQLAELRPRQPSIEPRAGASHKIASRVAPPSEPEQTARTVFDAAQAHHYQQRFAQARAVYREVVVRFPASREAARARQQLENLRDVRADDAITQVG